ncbi:MAG: hypothetical protein AAF390_12570, partial [Pseudomonadota bacterium]
RMRIRSIDVQLMKVFEELQQGRQAGIEDLRGDLGALTRTLRQLNRSIQTVQSTQEDDDSLPVEVSRRRPRGSG